MSHGVEAARDGLRFEWCARVQYPGEKEITFPPFTCLEADGDPRVERNQAGEIVVFPLKVSWQPSVPHAPTQTPPKAPPNLQ